MFSDPAFSDNRDKPIHRWVPWIAGFSGKFVADVIRKHDMVPSEESLVFDPFAGVGTTLVEAKMKGFDVKGAEINPYSFMACLVKLNWTVDLALFREQLSSLARFTASLDERTESNSTGEKSVLDKWVETPSGSQTVLVEPSLKPPSGFRTREPFFNSQTEKKMLLLKQFIQDVPFELRDHFRLAFGAALVKYSNYAYGPSLGRRSMMRIGQVTSPSVGRYFQSKMEEIYHDLSWLHEQIMPKLFRTPNHEVFDESIFSALSQINSRGVSLVVTSPPYLNNYHYPRNTRPQMYWLDLVKNPAELGKLEWENFGKFWQTVRELPPIEADFDVPLLAEVIRKIRARNPDKGIYGGNGWANYATSYFNDVQRFFGQFYDKMSDNGIIAWVVGNSILQGIEVKTEEFTAKIAEVCGFKAEGIYRIRKKRTGSSIVNTHLRNIPDEHLDLYDAAVILRK